MTQQQIADGLGVDRRLAARWQRRGMPMDSVEAAAAWRKAHTNSSYSRRPRPPVALPPGAPSIEAAQKAAETRAVPSSADEARMFLADLETTRRFAKEAADKLFADGCVEDARKWLVVHQAISNRYPVLRKEVLRIQKETAELLDAGEVAAMHTAHLNKLRAIIESWPSALASRLNPSDPELARAGLEAARDQLVRAMEAQ